MKKENEEGGWKNHSSGIGYLVTRMIDVYLCLSGSCFHEEF